MSQKTKTRVKEVDRGAWHRLALFAMAVCISVVVATFSLPGLATLYPGVPLSAMGIGATLEAAKLVTAWYLKRTWTGQPTVYHILGLFLVMFSMVVSVTGTYAYLTEAHLHHGVATAALGSERLATIVEEEKGARMRIADADSALGVIADAEKAASRRGKADQAAAMLKAQQPEKEAAFSKKALAQADLRKLAGERAAINMQRDAMTAQTGPLANIASVIGMTDQHTVNMFTLVLSLMAEIYIVYLSSASAATAQLESAASRRKRRPAGGSPPKKKGGGSAAVKGSPQMTIATVTPLPAAKPATRARVRGVAVS